MCLGALLIDHACWKEAIPSDIYAAIRLKILFSKLNLSKFYIYLLIIWCIFYIPFQVE